jgi:hypothetical protein
MGESETRACAVFLQQELLNTVLTPYYLFVTEMYFKQVIYKLYFMWNGAICPLTVLGSPLGPQEFEAAIISRHSAHKCGKLVNPMILASLLAAKYPWYSFLLEAESTPGPDCGQKDYVNETFQRLRRDISGII